VGKPKYWGAKGEKSYECMGVSQIFLGARARVAIPKSTPLPTLDKNYPIGQRFATSGPGSTGDPRLRGHLPGGPQARPNIYLILRPKYANREIFHFFKFVRFNP